MPKLGRHFEEAVFAFAHGLDPRAEVIFDHHVPDKDTGTPRQCDVWINATFAGHWPISILISCKDHDSKLDIGDIGTFCDEIRSTGARLGVIYSRKGFTKPALAKAETNGISCCLLYENQRADVPALFILNQLVCSPQVAIALQSDISELGWKNWSDILGIKEDDKSILDILVESYEEAEQKSIESGFAEKSFPRDWEFNFRFYGENFPREIKLSLRGQWRKYVALLEAHLVNGSYSIVNNSFVGTISGPWVDIRETDPGEGWKEVDDPNFVLPPNYLLMVRHRGDIRGALRDIIGAMNLTEVNDRTEISNNALYEKS